MKFFAEGLLIMALTLGSLCALSATQVPVTVVSQEVFLVHTIIAANADGHLSNSTVVVPFTSMQRCLDYKAKNGFLEFGVHLPDRLTPGVPAIHLIAVTSECAAK